MACFPLGSDKSAWSHFTTARYDAGDFKLAMTAMANGFRSMEPVLELPPVPTTRRKTFTSTHSRPSLSLSIRLPVACVIAAGLCLPFLDYVVGRFCAVDWLPREIVRFLQTAEHFGTPFGQLLVLGPIYCVYRGRFPQAVRILLGAVSAGMAANVMKLMLSRSRPRAFDFDAASSIEFAGFQGWFPLGTNAAIHQSFPSSHTACAFAFAALMTWAFPNGKWAFLTLATLCGIERIYTHAHFPSDVFIGAAIGWIIGNLFISVPWLNTCFETREKAWLKRQELKGQ